MNALSDVAAFDGTFSIVSSGCSDWNLFSNSCVLTGTSSCSSSREDSLSESVYFNTIQSNVIPDWEHCEDELKPRNESSDGNATRTESCKGPMSNGMDESVPLLERIDFECQLAEIGALQPGWVDGEGETFDKNQLMQLAVLFRKNYSLEKDPWVYPEQDGLLLAEWENGDWRFSMEIDLASMKGDFLALNVSNDKEYSMVFDLNDSRQWKILCDVLEHPETGVQP